MAQVLLLFRMIYMDWSIAEILYSWLKLFFNGLDIFPVFSK